MTGADQGGQDNPSFREAEDRGKFVLGRTDHDKGPEGMVVVGK